MLRMFLLIFSTWRLTHLLKSEDGPYALMHMIRHLLGVRLISPFPPNVTVELGMKEELGINDYHQAIVNKNIEQYVVKSTSELARALECFWCTSMWTSLLLLALLFFIPPLGKIMIWWMTTSGVAILLEEKR